VQYRAIPYVHIRTHLKSGLGKPISSKFDRSAGQYVVRDRVNPEIVKRFDPSPAGVGMILSTR